MPDRYPAPGPSHLAELPLRRGPAAGAGVDRSAARVGMSRPAVTDDGWWFTVLWVVDDAGALSFSDLAPTAGPPPEPPLHRLGPALSGALSGLILEEGGRLSIRLAPTERPGDPTRPWRTVAVVRAAFKFEPMRAAALGDAAVADAVLAGFRQAVEALGRP